MYRYFVSFRTNRQTGNTVIDLDKPLTTAGDIRTLEQTLCDEVGIAEIQVEFYQLMHHE